MIDHSQLEKICVATRTQRLELRPLMQIDAEEMFPILSDPAIYQFTHGDPPTSVEALTELYKVRESRQSPDGTEHWLNWIIRVRESNVAIGFTQATIAENKACIAWVVGTSWQRNGYASEAARAMINWLKKTGITKIEAHIATDHVASKKVAENVGLHETDHFCGTEKIWEG
jgi:RimJ/RimL family protein N-acetyltransferase